MFAVEIELLGGRYVATEHNNRTRAEWPPHPARFFSALVAALHDREPVDSGERAALLWLEQQAAPGMDVDLSVTEEVGRREVRPLFVPVNDVTTLGPESTRLHKAEERLAHLKRAGAESDAKAVAQAMKEVREAEGRLAVSLSAIDRSPAANSVEAARALLPDRRPRQERAFPVVVPSRATFAFIWKDASLEGHDVALRRLCERVTRLGHSSSLVRCTLKESPLQATLVPCDDGELVLRVVGPGQLDRLESAFVLHQAVEARVTPALSQRYGAPQEDLPLGPHSVFGTDWIVYERIGGHRPLASRGADLASAFRRALIEVNGQEDLPSMLSGHAPDGSPSRDAHLTLVPLPWVDHPFADASVQGIALILPRAASAEEREKLYRLLGEFESSRGDAEDDYSVELVAPSLGARSVSIRLRRSGGSAKATLGPARWCRAAQRFVTVTPITLDRYPGNLRSNLGQTAHKAAREAEDSIATACEQIGLPRPIQVSVSAVPLVAGAQHASQFAPWPRQPGRAPRARVHAEIVFSEAVRGPILLGAGRYYGLGLCLPVSSQPRATT